MLDLANDFDRVAVRVFDDRIAVGDRDPPDVELRRIEREQERETVINSRVGIDDDRLGHPLGYGPHLGSANAMIASPNPNGPPPPAAMTTNWRPPASYVIGVARAPAGKSAFHSSRPVSVSNARIARSSVAPMKTTPLAVAIGPPRFTAPGKPPMVPSGTFQAIAPVARFTATNAPNGGGVQGSRVGPRMMRRRMRYGVPRMLVYSTSVKPREASTVLELS